jgi:hypothetical protein
MSGAGLEPITPEFEQEKSFVALDSAATLIGAMSNHVRINTKKKTVPVALHAYGC